MVTQLVDFITHLRRIRGVQSLDSGKRKNPFGSSSQHRDSGSTGPNKTPEVPIITNAADSEIPEVDQEQLSRKRKDVSEVRVEEVGGSDSPVPKSVSISPVPETQAPQNLKD